MSEPNCSQCFHQSVCRYYDDGPGTCSDFVNESQVEVRASQDEINQGTRRLDYLCKKLVDLRTKFEKDPNYYIFKEIMNFHKEED